MLTLPFVLIGHQKISAYFADAITRCTLAQVYCLIGPAEVGKRAVAQEVARALLKTSGALIAHPDYHEIGRVTDEKTGKLKRDISVVQARELRERLQARSWSGGYQVLIIDEAEALSVGAANALLKMLEEPPQKTVIFLIVENERELLATIRSRAQCFYFSLVPSAQLRAGLLALGYAVSAVEETLVYSQGRPGRAITMLQQSEELAWYRHETQRWEQLLGKPFYQKLKQIETLFTQEDSVRARGELQRVLGYWGVLWREVLLRKTGVAIASGVLHSVPGPAQALSLLGIRENIDGLTRATELLDQNVHPRLVMESIVLDF